MRQFAQSDFEGPLVGAADEFKKLQASDTEQIILGIAQWFLVFVGIIAVIMALYSAFLFLTATDNEEQLKKAKKTLIWSLVGVAVAIVAFSIVVFTRSLL